MAPWGRLLWAVYLRVEVSSIQFFVWGTMLTPFLKDVIVAQVL